MKPLLVRAQQKGLRLRWQVADAVPVQIVADPGRLRQILVNLVGNAIKFTEAGGDVAVGVELAELGAQETGAVELRFAVRDTGIGIALEKQRIIFDAFAQADGSTARRYGGTGLGLTISSQLVALMGGRLWVESEVGRGSTFQFTARCGLPTGVGVADVPKELAYLRGLPVLVVDDNVINRRILAQTLRKWEMEATVVEGERAAVEALEHARAVGKPFALILLDVQIPESDGFALVERIEHTPGWAGATIMMLASGGRSEDAARARALGVAAYLTKPIRQADLLAALLTTLGMAAETGERRRQAERAEGQGGAQQRARGLRILLAEDNIVNQQLARRILEKRGHTVATVATGTAALAALEQEPFDLVLMDVQMPQLDGLETTAEIRRREREAGATRHLPIIAMTAHAMKGDDARCLNAGMDAYVAKPIHATQLIETIDSVLRTVQQAPTSDELPASSLRLADFGG